MSAPIDTPTSPAKPSRRDFLRVSALGLAVPVVAAACGTSGAESQAAPAATTAAAGHGTATDSNHSGGTTAPHVKTPAEIRAAADEMDRHHEAGIKAFPAKTEGKGNQLLQPRMENGVKVYELTAEKIQWETEPGKRVEAFAYNQQVPGPQIRVTEGDRVRFIIHNRLPESTAVHFHGLELPVEMDGVPFMTQDLAFEASTYVEPEQFERFAQGVLGRAAGLDRVGWVQRTASGAAHGVAGGQLGDLRIATNGTAYRVERLTTRGIWRWKRRAGCTTPIAWWNSRWACSAWRSAR